MRNQTCPFDLHMYEWYIDALGRIWVVVGFWYEKGEKDRVYLLQLGKNQEEILPYNQVLEEVKKKNMKILPEQTLKK